MNAHSYDEGYIDTEDEGLHHATTSHTLPGKNVDLFSGLKSVKDTEGMLSSHRICAMPLK